MSYVTIPSYEGNQPFIYVYYAEEDTRLALPVLVRLYNEGLRMWSWNGCQNPTEVRASRRIASCAALLIFLSDNLDRDISREYFEAMEALRCNKVKYFVRLSDVELPFDWGRSENNVVIDYARSNEAAFWLSIYDIDVIERCRGAWPSQPLKSGMSVFESIDSGEISDEYSNILKIIGESPTLDRSGVPINAEDIALFAGAGEADKKPSYTDDLRYGEMHIDDLNRQSIEDLFGMLDEISISTRQRAEEMQIAAEQRRQEQEAAALKKASLPFQHDVVKASHPEEMPSPALSFMNVANWIEAAARDMFGADAVPEIAVKDSSEDNEAVEMLGGNNEAVAEENEDTSLPDVSENPVIIIEDEQKEAVQPSFEAFIDELAGHAVLPSEDPSEEASEEAVPEAEPQEISQEEEEKAEELPMPTVPKTVEITEEEPYTLLPPASGSLTGFTLPDDNYITTAYIENYDEGDLLTAAERAAAAEESRKMFESAIEKAAYSVSGRIVARQVDGEHSMGLRVRKPKIRKTYIKARVKPPVKVSPILVQSAAVPTETEETEQSLSRAERRAARRRRRAERQEVVPEIVAEPIIEEPKKVSVTPEPVRPVKEEQPVQPSEPQPDEATEASEETAPSRRKKRHPHNSSGLIDVLRNLRARDSQESEDTASDSEEDI